MRRLAVVLVALILMSIGAPAARAMTDDPMSEGRAGTYYLTHACKSAAADDAYIRAVFKGRQHLYPAEVKRRLPELTRLSRRYGQAVYVWAGDLLRPPAPWPDSVGELPAKLADRNLAYSDAKRQEGSARTADEWIRSYNRAERISFGHYAAQIRARLALPAPGHGC